MKKTEIGKRVLDLVEKMQKKMQANIVERYCMNHQYQKN